MSSIIIGSCHLRATTLAALIACAVLSAHTVVAGDAVAGKQKAVACSTCHGIDRLSSQPDSPYIAGQSEFYLIGQLKKYRSGERFHPVMGVVARDLSDTDIGDLATYYSSIKISLEPAQ